MTCTILWRTVCEENKFFQLELRADALLGSDIGGVMNMTGLGSRKLTNESFGKT